MVVSLLLTIKECGESVDRYSVSAYVRQPDEEPAHGLDVGLTRASKEGEVALDAEAAQDKDAQLPLLPPFQSS